MNELYGKAMKVGKIPTNTCGDKEVQIPTVVITYFLHQRPAVCNWQHCKPVIQPNRTLLQTSTPFCLLFWKHLHERCAGLAQYLIKCWTSQAAGVYISHYVSLMFVFSLKVSSFFRENNMPSAINHPELVLRILRNSIRSKAKPLASKNQSWCQNV
jgi:hypothetical protein